MPQMPKALEIDRFTMQVLCQWPHAKGRHLVCDVVEDLVVHHICHMLLKSKQLYTTLEALIGNFREGSGRLQAAKMM